MTWTKAVRIVKEADRKAWKLHRAGGAVIGLAFFYHLGAGVLAAFRPSPEPQHVTKDLAAACCNR
jgi:hypothetical protein